MKLHGRRYREWLDAHVHEAVDRDGVVGVQRGEHDDDRERRLIAISAVSKSRISPTEDDVRILARKERSVAAKLGPIDLHLHLVDARAD